MSRAVIHFPPKGKLRVEWQDTHELIAEVDTMKEALWVKEQVEKGRDVSERVARKESGTMKTIAKVLLLTVVGCTSEFVDLDGDDCEEGSSRCVDAVVIERCEAGVWVSEDCRDGCPLAWPVGVCEPSPESGQSNCGCYEAPACPRCWPSDGPPMRCCFNDDCTIARVEDDGLPVCLPPLSGEAVCELGVWLCRP